LHSGRAKYLSRHKDLLLAVDLDRDLALVSHRLEHLFDGSLGHLAVEVAVHVICKVRRDPPQEIRTEKKAEQNTKLTDAVWPVLLAQVLEDDVICACLS